jgi:hypothetical protein
MGSLNFVIYIVILIIVLKPGPGRAWGQAGSK